MTFNTYVTFGQDHTHRVNGKTFDCDCVAVIECSDARSGRERAFEYFGRKFFTTYFDDEFHGEMDYYPRGFINVE